MESQCRYKGAREEGRDEWIFEIDRKIRVWDEGDKNWDRSQEESGTC